MLHPSARRAADAPRPEAADEQRIDDLIAQHLSVHKLEVLKQGELVRSLMVMPALPVLVLCTFWPHMGSHGTLIALAIAARAMHLKLSVIASRVSLNCQYSQHCQQRPTCSSADEQGIAL